jgi:DNA/RNA-binding domain of Phe-tRNA-synthetase-like protein
MKPLLTWSREAASRFSGLIVCTGVISDVKVKRRTKETESLKQVILAKMRKNYKIEQLKNDPTVRAYRDLYWSLSIDPTKTRPSGEALLRRVLHGNDIPSISNVVDAYNLASLETIIPLSGFDRDLISPSLEIRFSNAQDELKGIGMDKPSKFSERVLLVADEKQILCVYPYRDADATKITGKTKTVLIIGYGAPGGDQNQLVGAVEKALVYVERAAGGSRETVNVFQAT